MVSDTVIEQVKAIEALLPISIDVAETAAGDVVFDIDTPHGVIVKREPD